MNLLKWEGNRIVISPEAMTIKSFRAIWNADRSDSKEKAIMTLGTLYFMYDPRSEYAIEIDEGERLKNIKEGTGLASNWVPDKLFNNAVPVIKYLTNTTSSKILEGNRKAIESIRDVIEAGVPPELEADKKVEYAIKLAKLVSDANVIAENTAKLEKTIYADVEEQSAKLRGSGKQTIGDLGLKELFK